MTLTTAVQRMPNSNYSGCEQEERSLSRVLQPASQAEVGLTLMHVFISDLLGRTTNRLVYRLFRQVLERGSAQKAICRNRSNSGSDE